MKFDWNLSDADWNLWDFDDLWDFRKNYFGFEQKIRYFAQNLWHVYPNVHSFSTKMFEILTTTLKISIKMFEISTKTVWKFDLNHSDFFQNLEILTKTIVKPKFLDSKTLRSKTLEILTKILQILTKSNQIVTKI